MRISFPAALPSPVASALADMLDEARATAAYDAAEAIFALVDSQVGRETALQLRAIADRGPLPPVPPSLVRRVSVEALAVELEDVASAHRRHGEWDKAAGVDETRHRMTRRLCPDVAQPGEVRGAGGRLIGKTAETAHHGVDGSAKHPPAHHTDDPCAICIAQGKG